MTSSLDLDAAFGALADPTRRAIVERLALGPLTVGELAAPFDLTLQAVSKHLRVLTVAGLVERGRDAQRRPARLSEPAIAELAEWLLDFRTHVTEGYERLDELLARTPSHTSGGKKEKP
jgi:DNA-binding transcriptional ArsR family regulator